MFGLEYVRQRGYQRYLDSDSALEQIWDSAALLAEVVDKARSEGRELTPKERERVKENFRKASITRGEEG